MLQGKVIEAIIMPQDYIPLSSILRGMFYKRDLVSLSWLLEEGVEAQTRICLKFTQQVNGTWE